MATNTRTHESFFTPAEDPKFTRRWGEFALIDASVGQTFLQIAESTGDARRREKCVCEAQRALQAVDRLLAHFGFEHDQHASIVEARNQLAARLAATRTLKLANQ